MAFPIAFVWIGALNGKTSGTSCRAWLCVAAARGLVTSAVNLWLSFDTAAEAATLIRQHKLEKKLWFSFPKFQTLALTGESVVPFGNLERGCSVEFMRWKFRSRIRTHEQFYALVDNDGAQYRLWKVGKGPVADAALSVCVNAG